MVTTANDTGRSTWEQERVSAVDDDDSKVVFVNIHDRLALGGDVFLAASAESRWEGVVERAV